MLALAIRPSPASSALRPCSALRFRRLNPGAPDRDHADRGRHGTDVRSRGGPQTLAYLPFARNILTGDRRPFRPGEAILDLAPALGLGDPTIAWIHSAYGLMERLNADGFAETSRPRC